MMKQLLILIPFVFLFGCSGPAQQYILSEPQGTIRSVGHSVAQIGVDQVEVPSYLIGNKIPIQSGAGELTFCDEAVWATAPEKGLTQHLIGYLQKRFATPYVYRYPWDIEKSSGVRLKVNITRFLYVQERGSVVLEASYFVEPIQGKRRVAKLFHTEIPVRKGETALIVQAMNKAVDRLARQAAVTIRRF